MEEQLRKYLTLNGGGGERKRIGRPTLRWLKYTENDVVRDEG